MLTRHPLRLAAVLTVGLAAAYARPDPVLRGWTGFVSLELCSATFVSGVDPDRFFAESLAPNFGPIAPVFRFDVDRESREVRTTIAGGFASRAVDRAVAGCVLVHGVSPAALPADFMLTEKEPSLPPMAGPDPVVPQSEALRTALDRAFAESGEWPPHWTKAVVVAQGGNIVAERYADGYGIDTQLPGNSMTKSVMSALVGILVREGRVRVDDAPVAAWEDPHDPRHAITIDELLRMTSGLPFDESSSFLSRAARLWFLESDQAAFAASAELVSAPGTEWHYSDGGYAILARIVRDRVGGRAEDALRFAHVELFAPLGMHNVTVQLDSTGTPIGSRAMLASARDWTRFGQLYLEDGMAGSRRILPEGWVAYSTTPSRGPGYGAGFWLNVTDAERPGGWLHWGMLRAPRDAFFAQGYLGQYVVVVPSARLVVARFGVSHGRGQDVELVGRLVADVIDALGAR